MLLECSRCGAPLDVRGNEEIVTCRYCRTKTQRAVLRTIAAETPSDFRPPLKWGLPDDATGSLEEGAEDVVVRRPLRGIVGVAVPLVALLAVLGFGLYTWVGGSLSGMPLERTLELDVRGKVADVARRLDGRVIGTNLYIDTNSPEFQSIFMSWENEQAVRPRNFGFLMREGAKLPPGTCERLAASLGPSSEGSWGFSEVAYVHCKASSPQLVAGLAASKDALSSVEEQDAGFDLLRRLVVEAALGRPSTVPTSAMKQTLGIQYTWDELSAVDVEVELDAAAEMFRRVLPGTRRSDGTRFHVYMSHPFLRRVFFEWENKAHGKLSSVFVAALDSQDFGREQQNALAACLEQKLDKPEVIEADHVKQEVHYRFGRRRDGDLWVYKGAINFNQPSARLWAAAVDAIQRCPLAALK